MSVLEGVERLLGSQTPTHKHVPEYQFSRGDQAIEIAELAGLQLDPYQKDFLIDGLGIVEVPSQLHSDQRLVEQWSSLEVAIELSRQNGKSVAFEARVLAGIYMFGEELIVYSAHKAETAMGAYRRIEHLIRSNDELLAEVKPNGFRQANGKEAIEFMSGQVIKFRTRTAGGGRGLSGDCVILDEAQDLTDDHLAALFPVLSARPNPQLWYGGSAGTKKSTVLGRLVRRADNGSPRLTMHRWAGTEDMDRDDPRSWARVNPAVGRRITIDFIASERASMTDEKFDNERMGRGDYPRPEGEEWVVPRRRWEAAEDKESAIAHSMVFCPEVDWDRTSTAISVAGRRADGHMHMECIAAEAGTLWAVQDLKKLTTKWPDNLGVVIDPGSPAKTLIGPLRDAGIEPVLLKIDDLITAWGDWYDALMAEEDRGEGPTPKPTYHHRGGLVLTAALAEAQTRQLGGAVTWKRLGGLCSPIISATWAAHGVKLLERPTAPPPPPQKVSGGPQGQVRGSETSDLATIAF